MVTKKEYKKACKIIEKYKKQLEDSSVVNKRCWIMRRVSDNLTFVTINENYAKSLYESGDYFMIKSKIINLRN